jgi:cytochrome c oxidase cbb3-type subunit 3
MLKNKNTILLLMAGCSSLTAFGQAAAPLAKPTNYLEILMLVIAVLLVPVIWVLTSTLIMISKKVVELAKSNKTAVLLFMVLGTSLFSNNLMAQGNVVADAAAVVVEPSFYGGLSSTTFWMLSSVLALELVIIFMLVLFVKNILSVIHPAAVTTVNGKPVTKSWIVTNWNKLDKQFFTKAAPIEQEADILLDHDYDGIKELDNALPPWWKYGFYITIFIAVIYILKFEVWHTGMNPTEEYNAEMTAGKAQVNAYLAASKENVDENSVVALTDAPALAAGKEIFGKTCVACHLADGGGSVGPNLTDEYWIHSGGIADIFKTLKYGWPDKGMQAWASTYSPVQLQQIASYVMSLKGTKPANPKAPQGELYKAVAAAMDSTNNTGMKKDSVATK